VVVLGSKTASDLFGEDDPVGQKVKIKERRFTVVGVLEAKGGAMMGISEDELVLVPITTYHARLFTQRTASGEDAVQSIVVQVTSAEAIDSAVRDIEDVLRQRHRLGAGDEDDFEVISQEQILGTLQQITGVLTLFLGAIAGISLLVGGIGIMNIMLVSVTERTREIGVRKAIGAKRRDILRQFLLEAAMISLVGSGVGVVVGAANLPHQSGLVRRIADVQKCHLLARVVEKIHTRVEGVPEKTRRLKEVLDEAVRDLEKVSE